MDFVLYNYYRSSASYRARIALNLKGFDFEYRAVHLLNNGGEQYTSDYSALNPSQEVPTLVHKGQAIAQTMAIFDYLDHLEPAPALFPKEPHQRAFVIQACEIVNSGIQPVTNLRVLSDLEKRFHADSTAKEAWLHHWFKAGLTSLEAFVKPHAGDYAFGQFVTAADCFIVPQLTTCDRFKHPLDDYPTLKRIRANCEKLAAFKKARPGAQPDTPPEAQN